MKKMGLKKDTKIEAVPPQGNAKGKMSSQIRNRIIIILLFLCNKAKR
jgi:hypothetical protein